MKRFPIVCVGGSAGGLDAYIRLLKHLPADLHFAFDQIVGNFHDGVALAFSQLLRDLQCAPIVEQQVMRCATRCIGLRQVRQFI